MTETVELTREVRDRRVAIARDVLAQMARADPARLRPQTGVYVALRLNRRVDNAADLGAILSADNVAYCETCALGALLVSKARLYDQVPLHKLCVGEYSISSYGGDSIRTLLAGEFDADTLYRIEAYFERWDVCDDRRDEVRSAFFGSATRRLAAICEDIVANNGEFTVAMGAPIDEDDPEDDADS